MKKKTIKNAVSVKFINEEGKTYTTDKKDFNRVIKKWKIQMLALGIVVGAISPSIITTITNNVRNSEDTKQAIQIAATTDNYLKNLKSSPIMQAVISQEETMKIENLSAAIVNYKELKHKDNKSFREQEEYIQACKTISESKDLVTDMYTDAIKVKVARAYGITDLEEINKIEVTNYTHSTSDGPQIVLPDGRTIRKDYFMNKDLSMNETLATHITKARSLREAGEFSENKKIEDLPTDDIIGIFEEAKKFTEDYTIFSNKNGDIEAVETKLNEEITSEPLQNDEVER